MIDAGIFSLLSTSALIVPVCGTRIYPLVLPEDAKMPAMTYHQISITSYPTFNTSGFQRWRLQFDCFGKTYGDAANLRNALRKTLNGYQGMLNDGTYLQNADLLQITDFYRDDARTFRCMAEFYLYFCFQN